MNDPIPISVNCSGEEETPVEFPEERITITLNLVRVGLQLFRIRSVPMMVDAASFGDVIEAEARTDGGLRFVRIAERGGWRSYDFILPAEMTGSKHITAIQDRVQALGGHWERVFGGVLFLCLPPTTDYNPSEDIQRAP